MHKVFVYGTLKRGFRNHHLLKGARLLVSNAMVTGLCLRAGPYQPYATAAHADGRMPVWVYIGNVYGGSYPIIASGCYQQS